ncbi:MAG: hypothetical protein M1823_007749, partial [Watsoniomyces obsoletus]
MSSVVGTGFDFLRSSETGMSLYEVFEMVCELTIALDQYTRGGVGAPDMIDLLPARSAAQHQLLSLDFSEGEDDVVDRKTAEICRIAALIFSDMVVFPVPAAQQMKPFLAARLKILLEGLGVDALQNVNAEILLWATTLGCIASTFATEHDWYLQQLKTQLSSSRIPDWFALQK